MPARILVVEDTPANLELMEYLLKAHGYVVLAAVDGNEALLSVERDRPHLVVSDIQMPGMDGYELARRLKSDASFRSIPLVAVTALAMVGDRDRVLAAGFDGYIGKPIDPETFIRSIETFLPRDRHRDVTSPRGDSGIASRAATVPDVGRTILAVDNLEVNLELARSILEPHGFAMLQAEGIGQALSLLERNTVHLVLSDLCMGDDDGYDFIRMVKADPRFAAIPFVFLTSTKYEPADRAKGLALGAARYLTRPLDPAVLLAEIRACLLEAGTVPG